MERIDPGTVLTAEFSDAASARAAIAAARAHGLTDTTVVDQVTRLRSPDSFLEEAEAPAPAASRLVLTLTAAAAIGVVALTAGHALGVVMPGYPIAYAAVLGGLASGSAAAAGWALWHLVTALGRGRVLRRSFRVLVHGDVPTLVALRRDAPYAKRATRP